jgi:formate dehydrogenase subunit gamma
MLESSFNSIADRMNARSPQDMQAAVGRVLAELAHLPGALLPVLHGVQDALGYIPPDAVPEIARALNLSRAEVHGVITYYHHFREAPSGSHVLQVCRAESCRAMGAESLLSQARAKLGCSGTQQLSADGTCSVEPVYCLGLCASSPAVTLDGRPHARMTPERLDALLAEKSRA